MKPPKAATWAGTAPFLAIIAAWWLLPRLVQYPAYMLPPIGAVLDYHGPARMDARDTALPGTCRHVVTLACPWDPDYQRWRSMSIFNKVTKTFQWGQHTVTLETGEVARQSTGAVLVDIEGTVVLATVVAKTEAKARGADDAWLVAPDGYVTEGASSNAWIVTKDGEIITRALSNMILAGITRHALFDALGQQGRKITERSFTLQGVQSRLLGGTTRLEGGLRATPPAGEPPLLIKAQGQISAEGLRAARQWPPLDGLARQMKGQTTYSATLGWRNDLPELQVQSTLEGLELQLPPPLSKRAAQALPLLISARTLGARGSAPRDLLEIQLGKTVSARYERDLSGPEPRALRGALAVGTNASAMSLPEQGVSAVIRVDDLSLDAWEAALPMTMGTMADAARALQLRVHSVSTSRLASDSAAATLSTASTHLRVSSNQSLMNWVSMATAEPPCTDRCLSTMRS